MPLYLVAAGAAGALVWFGKEVGEGAGDALKIAAVVGVIAWAVTR